jgi:hypothetical protein
MLTIPKRPLAIALAAGTLLLRRVCADPPGHERDRDLGDPERRAEGFRQLDLVVRVLVGVLR